MRDVMGLNGLSTLLSLSGLEAYMENPPPDNLARQFDFISVASLSEGLESMYGSRGGRGMALRIGRASFAQGMRGFGAYTGMQSQAFKDLSIEEQVQLAIHVLQKIYNTFSDQETTVEDHGETYHITLPNSPFIWGRTTDRPACHMMVGIIQESLQWASSGHEFHVQEIGCRATGNDQCVFRVNKNPIGQS